MEHSSFFDSENHDRKYAATDIAAYFSKFIGNGVFPNPSTNLQVIANNDMTVTVKAGPAWINGYMYLNDSDLILSIDAADGVLNRIDRIVVKYDTAGRIINAVVKKGTFASSPVAPTLQRDADAYELGTANIYIAAGATSIIQDNITDTRLDSTLCGLSSGLVQQVDVTTLFNQYTVGFQGKEADFENQFNTWFATIQGQLSGDVAGNLSNQINSLAGDGRTTETVKENADAIAELSQEVTSHEADNSKQIPHLGTTANSGDAYSITTAETIGANEKFTIKFNTASTSVPTLNINSDEITGSILKANGNNAKLYASVYTLFWDGTNFILLGEGGEYGTATAGDVRITKTLGTENGVVQGALDLTNLTSDNLKSGISIDGVTGNLSPKQGNHFPYLNSGIVTYTPVAFDKETEHLWAYKKSGVDSNVYELDTSGNILNTITCYDYIHHTYMPATVTKNYILWSYTTSYSYITITDKLGNLIYAYNLAVGTTDADVNERTQQVCMIDNSTAKPKIYNLSGTLLLTGSSSISGTGSVVADINGFWYLLYATFATPYYMRADTGEVKAMMNSGRSLLKNMFTN